MPMAGGADLRIAKPGPMPRVVALAGAAALSVDAGAATPSRLWWGVERILVDCAAEASLPPSSAALLCDQYLQQIRARTSYPVAIRSSSRPGDPESELWLKIELAPGAAGTVQLIVEPRRPGVMNKAPETLVSRVQGPLSQSASLVSESLNKVLPSR